MNQFRLIQGAKDDLEIELVKKLKAKTFNSDEIKELINRITPRKDHLNILKNDEM